MRRSLALLFLVPFLLPAAACGPRIVISELDRLEASLELTPAQRPAWEAFRREAEAAGSARAGWRLEIRQAAAGERFDRRRAHAAADQARRDAGRLIEAWARLDETLSPAQRRAVRPLLELTPE